MAFDLVTRSIGVAVGNTLTCLGQPIKTIAESSSDAAFKVIEGLLKEWVLPLWSGM